jgi:hypothetical protein
VLRNTLFDTWPAVIHGHGRHRFKPHWDQVRDSFWAADVRPVPAAENLTVLTCNNGHEAMGMLERSCQRWGQPYLVCGQGRTPWVNSRDKPEAILGALREIATEFVLYADSRDAIVVRGLAGVLEILARDFPGCHLLMGADRINWPNLAEFKRYEESLPGARNPGKFSYLNGGVWLGRRDFALELFEEVLRTPPVPEAPDSEQGLLKRLFPRYYPRMQLDYQSKIIANLGFVLLPIMELPCPPSSSTANSAIASVTTPARD